MICLFQPVTAYVYRDATRRHFICHRRVLTTQNTGENENTCARELCALVLFYKIFNFACFMHFMIILYQYHNTQF